jgi:hypothetical protein
MTVISVVFTVLLESAAPIGTAGAVPVCADPPRRPAVGGRPHADLWTTAAAVDDSRREPPDRCVHLPTGAHRMG